LSDSLPCSQEFEYRDEKYQKLKGFQAKKEYNGKERKTNNRFRGDGIDSTQTGSGSLLKQDDFVLRHEDLVLRQDDFVLRQAILF
jgi:hypothetical protein